jgi:hypothetical protein
MGTGTVLLWDATHQDFPVQGVESPTTAAGTGGWLIGIEESPEGIIEVFAWNASTQVRSEVGGSPWSVAPKVIVTESNFVLFTDSRVDLFSLDSISQLITPKYSQYSAEEIVDVFITEDIGGEVLIGIVHTNEILFRSEEGFVTIEVPDGPYSICSSSGSFIATGRSSESGPIVEIFTIDSQFSLSINVNVIADEITDEHLEDTFEIPVNYTNSTIVELEFDSRWIAAVVDIGPLNRTVLIDTISGDQLILSDSVWPSSSVSLAHGKVAFLQIPRFDPTQDEEDQLTARDVFLHDIAENRTKQLTIDEDIDQSQPQVLNSAVAYLQEDEDGEVNIHLFALEETFEPYSSVVLQSAIVIIIPLMVLLAFQSALENKKSR